MKQIKKMHSGNIYMIQGECGANSVFFENEGEAKLFLHLVDHYLSEYVEINNFQNSKDGWILIITVRSEEDVFSAYQKRRDLSKKCKPEFKFEEIWQILSDQIRILLSCYVKTTNNKNGRQGGKVKSSYRRYYFENIEEAVEKMNQMESQEVDQCQPRKKYQGDKSLFDFSESQLRDNVYMCCRKIREGFEVVGLKLKGLRLLDLTSDVLGRLIKLTLSTHSPQFSP